MGVVDITQKEYFTDKERFADFVNAVYFNGRKVVRPEEDAELRRTMLEMLPDYKIRVYDLNKEKDFSVFRTDLKTVFEFYSRHNDGNSMREYIEEHREEVDGLDRESRFFLSKILRDRALTKVLRNKEKKIGNKEENGMCKAIDELREMSRQEGILQGRAEIKAELENVKAEKEHIIFLLQQKIEKLEGQLALQTQ